MSGILKLGSMAVVALLLFSASPAGACSVREGYRVPTNFELVEQADLIVLGTVVGGPVALSDKNPFDPGVVIRADRVLKGSPPKSELRVMGTLAHNGQAIPSLPTTLDQSHYSAGMGACVRIFYPKGGQVVAMFKHMPAREGIAAGMYQISEPWARAVEDVEGADAVWVQTVEEYIALQRAPQPERKGRVVARREELLAQKDNILAQSIADDLLQYLVAAGGQAKPAAQARWGYVSGPLDAALFIGKPPGAAGVVLECRKGSRDVKLSFVGRKEKAQLALLLDTRAFAVKAEQAGTLEGKDLLTGRLPLTPDLLAGLRDTRSNAGASVNGAAVLMAPPRDALHKFADRCRALGGS